MAHGDDIGLRLPPAVAPVQVIIIAVKDDPDVDSAVQRIEGELTAAGVRVRADRRTEIGLGRRLTEWELKGVPVRIEVGPRDLAADSVSLVRRDRPGRTTISPSAVAGAAVDAIAAVQRDLYAQAATAQRERIVDVADLEEAIEAAGSGFARLAWSQVGVEGERWLNAAGVSVRCLTTPDGSLPPEGETGGLIAVLARAY